MWHAELPLHGHVIVIEELSLRKVINFLGVLRALLLESLPEQALELGRCLIFGRRDRIECDSGWNVELATKVRLLARRSGSAEQAVLVHFTVDFDLALRDHDITRQINLSDVDARLALRRVELDRSVLVLHDKHVESGELIVCHLFEFSS